MTEDTVKEICIWEMYKINPTFPISVLDYANWTAAYGFQFNPLEKCRRRRNLQVNFGQVRFGKL